MKKNIIKKILCIGLAGFSFMMTAPQNAFAAWKKDNIGSWYTEGNSWATGWRQIDGVWYYFNSDGYMATGWKEVNGKWYFLSIDTGAMLRSCKVDGYLLGADGAWIEDESNTTTVAGWKQDNTGWWYLEENGDYSRYWKSFDKDEYEIDEYGQSIQCKVWYYFGSDGYMKTGWQYVGGKWYYFNSNGEMESDAVINGYVLDKDGAMIDSLFVKKEDGNIILKPVNEVNPIGTKEIKFYIVNNKDVEFTSYWNPNEIGPYLLEKYENGDWKTVRYRSPYDDSECIPAYINILHIKKVHLETIPLDKFDDFDGSKPGKYRIGFSGYYDGSDTSEDIVYTEFEIK